MCCNDVPIKKIRKGNMKIFKKAMRSRGFWYDWIILFIFIMFGAEAKSSNHDGFATIWAFLAGWWGLFMLLNYLDWIERDKK